jgi:hypothetical protein
MPIKKPQKRNQLHLNIKAGTFIGVVGILVSVIGILVSILIHQSSLIHSLAIDSKSTQAVTEATASAANTAALGTGGTWEQDGFSLTLLNSSSGEDNIFSEWQIVNNSSQSIPVVFDVDNFDVYDAKNHKYIVTGLGMQHSFPSPDLDFVIQPGSDIIFWTSTEYVYPYTSARDIYISVINIGTIVNAKWLINVDEDLAG